MNGILDKKQDKIQAKKNANIQAGKKKRLDGLSPLWNAVMNIVLAIFTFTCVFPFIFIIIISLTEEKTLALNGYKIFPEKLSLEGYKFILDMGDQMYRSYVVTISVTVIGTMLSLLIMTLYAYAIFRKDFRYRKIFSFMALFTMLFNAGLVPLYIVCTQFLHLRNTLWALIIPLCVNAFHILILRTFFQTTVPDSLVDSASIDGAGEFRTFFQIVLPISLPAIATIALFSTLSYWNEWFSAMLYIDNPKLIPVQFLLMQIETRMEFLIQNSSKMTSNQANIISSQIPRETGRMALVVFAAGPIVLAYPFFQRYFVHGLTVGAVKG